MRMGRLFFGIALLAAAFGVAVWLVVRSNELSPTAGKPPPTTFAANGGLKSPLLPRPVDSEETVPTTPEITFPNLLARRKGQLLLELLAGNLSIPTPSAATIDLYLRQHNRNAASLLTVWQVTGNLDYLREAATRFQADPQVQFVVLASNTFPEDRDKWINLFKQSASFNPLANYFAAHEYFRQNQTEQAVAELAAASGQGIDDYTAASFQERQELFVAAGASSPIESKGNVIAVALPILQPYLETMKALAEEMAGAQAAYTAAGDSASAQRLAQAGVVLGRQMGGGRLLIHQIAGIEIEESILRQLPPDDSLDWLGQSPANRLAELQQQREQIQTLSASASTALPQMDEATVGAYIDQVIQFGELEAMKWLTSRSTSSP